MCLAIDKDRTKRWRRRHAKRRRIVMWKVVKRLSSDKGLRSPIKYRFRWHQGWNKARGKLDVAYGVLHGGAIHVYRTRTEAAVNWGRDMVMRVTVKPADLVACGLNGDAAFRKVFVCKADYETALAGKKPPRRA